MTGFHWLCLMAFLLHGAQGRQIRNKKVGHMAAEWVNAPESNKPGTPVGMRGDGMESNKPGTPAGMRGDGMESTCVVALDSGRLNCYPRKGQRSVIPSLGSTKPETNAGSNINDAEGENNCIILDNGKMFCPPRYGRRSTIPSLQGDSKKVKADLGSSSDITEGKKNCIVLDNGKIYCPARYGRRSTISTLKSEVVKRCDSNDPECRQETTIVKKLQRYPRKDPPKCPNPSDPYCSTDDMIGRNVPTRRCPDGTNGPFCSTVQKNPYKRIHRCSRDNTENQICDWVKRFPTTGKRSPVLAQLLKSRKNSKESAGSKIGNPCPPSNPSCKSDILLPRKWIPTPLLAQPLEGIKTSQEPTERKRENYLQDRHQAEAECPPSDPFCQTVTMPGSFPSLAMTQSFKRSENLHESGISVLHQEWDEMHPPSLLASTGRNRAFDDQPQAAITIPAMPSKRQSKKLACKYDPRDKVCRWRPQPNSFLETNQMLSTSYQSVQNSPSKTKLSI
ncbi:uncharacterized protein LOC116618957 [Nematostella vectensis]|uniref:uncharacterized protein LOC116618957 n=1 Tax=Nematostella vectensis TaxID=45351 RepID=UPI0020779055|nr:uncharacterized protein LOC116618957 [Nematostella vectensis]